MNSSISDKSFTQQWLQALTLVAREPVAQRIKPMLETVNDLTRPHCEGDRRVSARRLWDFASEEGLLGMLGIMPIEQPVWIFDTDDTFAYRRQPGSDQAVQATGTSDGTALTFDRWTSLLGIDSCEIPLIAEVNSRDWSSLLRQEAVRLQQSLSTAAVPAGLTLHLKCKAQWDTTRWSIRFDDAQWMVVAYDDPFSVERPTMQDITDPLSWAIAQANDTLVPKAAGKLQWPAEPTPWIDCVPAMRALHESILVSQAKHYAPWFRRVWTSVWTVIYREQNVLGGRANIDQVRQELAVAIKEAPRLTLWMFVLAKLVCECQLGRGLGISADYLA